MKALVTGCSGFIGSHLCERLLHTGWHVTGVDCFTDYYPLSLKRRNLAPLLAASGFVFEQRPVSDINAALLPDADAIFHLAAQPGVRGSWGQSFDTYVANNISGTQHLLEVASTVPNLKKFVYASSSSVYGNISAQKVDEEHPTRPFSPYGVTKLAAEHLCGLYAANHSVPAVSLRFFTVYGPRQRPDMAFHRLISAALAGSAFPLNGGGTQERDFTFVGDIVNALIQAATIAGPYRVYNVGGGHVVSMNYVIELVQTILKTRIKVETVASQKGDVQRTGADVSRARAELGYRPATGLADGLTLQAEAAALEYSAALA